ncbi:MAG: riboflavin synthase [Actinobacteria bacterium HGW-Actinobacteria-1]|jgi:riboflavin synthase|nr:MAG: riboflavin synthase [Actinobacteria bacterium HGW-Actinobacteria-1]
MFTGLIECEGIITRAERVSGGMRLEVYAPEFGRDMAIGDSIAVDGVCLTVVKFIRGAFLTDVSGETLERTTLGALRQGSKVNLERALRLSDRLGGHIVSGHIDGVGRIELKQQAGKFTVYQIQAPAEVMAYVIEKGSIAVDGISLTVARVGETGFTVAVIPQTEETTTLKEKPNGAPVNLEADMLGKYVKRFVALYAGVDDDTPAAGKRGLGDMLREFTEGR